MRLWHKSLIPYLPRKQLLGQWRECCAIAKAIEENGTPNHILVNKILDYPCSHLNVYAVAIADEMRRRGYKCDFDKFRSYWINRCREVEFDELFDGWHNDRYLRQCYYNLQEKYDCGGISLKEWKPIMEYFMDYIIKKEESYNVL